MCGFVVTTEQGLITTMLERQKHRGPEDHGYWLDKRLAFGHVLLDINGEHQVQPYKTKKGNILVFNGEMYDSNISNDTAFLGNGMDLFGWKFISNTDWHGSFVYYKPKEGKLIIGRDHFGAKPLWIYKNGDTMTITTSLRSIISKKTNHKMRRGYMINPLWIGKHTPYQDIIKVPPGHLYIYDFNTKRFEDKSLWKSFRLEGGKFEAETFKHKLVNSVRKVAKNKQKTALFLSGGLDSTCALGILKDEGLDLTAYICDYSKEGARFHDHDGFRTEAKMAIATCKEWGVPYKVIKLQHEFVHHYHRLWLNHTHFPWVDMNRTAPRYSLCKAAAKDGCKVVLTGDSADELFTGYHHHSKYFKEGYCKETITDYASRQKWIPKIWNKNDWMNSALWYDLLTTSEQNILATDQTTGMFGMESRPVFLSQSFSRYILPIGSDIKFIQHEDYSPGTYKYLLREEMSEYLPKHIKLRKGKTGWSSPWDNNHGELQRLWKLQDLEFIEKIV